MPRYPEEALGADSFETIVELLRRRHAAVNGTFAGSSCRVEDNHFIVTLSHGGYDLLKTTKTDAALSDLIQELFGKRVELEFDGVLDTDPKDDHYRKMMEEAARDMADRLRSLPAPPFCPADVGREDV